MNNMNSRTSKPYTVNRTPKQTKFKVTSNLILVIIYTSIIVTENNSKLLISQFIGIRSNLSKKQPRKKRLQKNKMMSKIINHSNLKKQLGFHVLTSNCFCTALGLFFGLLGSLPTSTPKSSSISSFDRDTINALRFFSFSFLDEPNSKFLSSSGPLQAAQRVLKFHGLAAGDSSPPASPTIENLGFFDSSMELVRWLFRLLGLCVT